MLYDRIEHTTDLPCNLREHGLQYEQMGASTGFVSISGIFHRRRDGVWRDFPCVVVMVDTEVGETLIITQFRR